MGTRKINCENTSCKHNKTGGVCGKNSIKISYGARCSSFEKGVVYYFRLVWDKLEHTNMIPVNDLTDDLRIGIHFVMRAFHVGFSEIEWGTWRMIVLQKEEGGEPLKTNDIIEMEIDSEEFNKILEEVESCKLPEIVKKEPKIKAQPFGWLSPTGEFTEGDYGDHEAVAEEIINKKGFRSEWRESIHTLARDFLSGVKGYCLIHNPSMDGGYIVTNAKQLTKAQREFLYQYFIDLGDRFKAELYLQEV